MKRILLNYSGYFLFFLIVLNPDAKSQAKLPAVELKSLDGEEIRLSDYTALDKVLVISFWATYCPPCLEEFSRVSNLYTSWKKEVDFEFIAVSIDDNKTCGRIRGMAESKKWPFIMLIDEMKAAKNALGYSDIPYYYITDRHGNIVFSHEGYSPGDEKTMFAELKKACKH